MRLMTVLVFAVWAAGGCSCGGDENTIVDGDTDSDTDTSTGTGTDADTDTDTDTDTDSNSSGVCANGQILCGGVCTDISSDEANCGRCENPCGAGQTCGAGVCGGDPGACPDGMVDCGGGECRDVSGDPENCGACVLDICGSTEFCLDGVCACRPGLSDCGGGDCVDTATDPDHCGGCNMPCDGVCAGGACGNSCAATECDGACVDTATDPLHCGSCDNSCDVDQICISGDCWDYEPAAGCVTCDGCDVCPGGETCCDVAVYGTSCVDTEVGCP